MCENGDGAQVAVGYSTECGRDTCKLVVESRWVYVERQVDGVIGARKRGVDE